MEFRPAIDSVTGEVYLPVRERGVALLEEPLLNKGTAFTALERDQLGLWGLLPAHTSTMRDQLARVRNQLELKPNDLERHIYLASLHDRNEILFHRYILEHLEETVPIIYTPIVAEACRYWSRIFRRARGIYVTARDRGSIVRALRSRGVPDPAVIVVTDNERILGIGDQGAGGMGIPIGKLALYSVAAGIHPSLCIPVSIDVGTNNDELLTDPLYLGVREPRLRGDDYWALIDEFVTAVREAFPYALLQWEDFANTTSFHNLDTYRETIPSFNDDIQGTAAVVTAGLLAAMRRLGSRLADQTLVIAGAGSAGTGIADQVIDTMIHEGDSLDEARRRVLVLDSKGLLVEGRDSMDPRKQHLAVPRDVVSEWGITGDHIDLSQVIGHADPTVLIGVTGKPGTFTEPMIKHMAETVPEPIVMPLSNPTAKTEADPEHILQWSSGRAIVATGSPFDDVVLDGIRHKIGQANNLFVFPGMGLGVIVSRARQVTTRMFTVAATTLADCVTDDMLQSGMLYPPVSEVRAISHRVALAVAEQAVADGVAHPVVDAEGLIEQTMWSPVYLPYRPA